MGSDMSEFGDWLRAMDRYTQDLSDRVARGEFSSIEFEDVGDGKTRIHLKNRKLFKALDE